MKKLLFVLLASTLVACSSSTTSTIATTATATPESTATASAEVTATTETTSTDTVSSASLTRNTLTGDDFDAAIDELVSASNDLATLAETKEDGYEEPTSGYAQVLSTNSDGSVGMSTIHAWNVEKTDTGATITVVMTDGRTISNLINEGDRGTIIIHGSAYYILHVENINTVTLEYSDEAYEAGEFNSAYSGADNKLCEYTVTFNIYDLESTYVYMFD